MKKTIKYRVENTEKGTFLVEITAQSHRNEEFGPLKYYDYDNKRCWIASNGTALVSSNHPAIDNSDKLRVFVRGEDQQQGSLPMEFPTLQTLHNFMEAVLEYNNFEFKDPAETEKAREYKHIKIAYTPTSNKDIFDVQIVEQTHTMIDFGRDDKDYFLANNGLTLQSRAFPQKGDEVGEPTKIFVRGSDNSEDSNIISLSKSELDRLCEAVREYNAYFSQPQKSEVVAAQEPTYVE